MPHVNEVSGTAAATSPAFTIKEDLLIGSPGFCTALPESSFLALSDLNTLIANLRRSSTSKNGSITILQAVIRKNATMITARSDKNIFTNIPANMPMISRRVTDQYMMEKRLFAFALQVLNTDKSAVRQ